MLGQRGFAFESVVARICIEGGGRVRANIMFRDFDMELPHVVDARRLEVVVDGLPQHGGRQLVVDTTLVGVLHANGDEDGVRLVVSRRRKEKTCSNWMADGAEPRWLSSLGKSVDSGQERPGSS